MQLMRNNNELLRSADDHHVDSSEVSNVRIMAAIIVTDGDTAQRG